MTLINDVTDYAVSDGVAVITIDFPPVNALGHAVRSGISAGLHRAFCDDDVIAAVLICAGRTFFAGADIREFGKPLASPVLREIAVQIEAACKPVVAAIHGSALGGGLELALSCHGRIAEESALLGLPEVKLGLLPGAGGTQRLPRLVGLERALEMIVSGDPIGAAQALQDGLIDRLAGNGRLREAAIAFARETAAAPDALRRVRDLPAPAPAPDLLAGFRRSRADKIRGFDAPEACIRCIEAATALPFEEGMKFERQLFEQLMAGTQCAAQRYLFFAEREAARVPGLPREAGAHPLETALVIGTAHAQGIVARLRAAGLAVSTEDRLPPDGGEVDLVLVLPGVNLPASDAARLAKHSLLLACGDAPEPAIRIGFGGAQGKPALFEFLHRRDLADELVVTLLALGKRLGLATVVTAAGGALIGEEMERTLTFEIARCLGGGVDRDELAGALSGFGICLPLPDFPQRLASPPIPAALALDGILAACIQRGRHLLEQDAAIRAADIDVACVKRGLWKAYRGGPMFHAGQIGAQKVLADLEAHRRRFGGEASMPPTLEDPNRSGDPHHHQTGDVNV